MSSQDITRYLSDQVNRSENIKDLLGILMRTTSSKACAVFMYDDKTGAYICLEHVDTSGKSTSASLSSCNALQTISVDASLIEDHLQGSHGIRDPYIYTGRTCRGGMPHESRRWLL